MHHKMGILRYLVSRFHKAYDGLYSMGLLYRKNLQRVVSLQCVQICRKVTMGLRDNTRRIVRLVKSTPDAPTLHINIVHTYTTSQHTM